MAKSDFKQKFRSSKAWKDLRHRKFVEQEGKDPITKRKLYKMANLHHLDQRAETYTDISDEQKFVLLNHEMHETLHNVYKYWKNDKEFLKRIEKYLILMERYSNE